MHDDLMAQIATAKKRLEELSTVCHDLHENGDKDALSIYERVSLQREQAREQYCNLLAPEL